MKYLIGLILVFSFAGISAQTEQNFIINTTVGYRYTYEAKLENIPGGITAHSYDKETNDLKLSFAIGKKFRSNFYYGLGFSYNIIKVERNPGVDKPRYDSDLGIYFSTTNSVSTRTVFGPMAYLQYNLSLGERSRFTMNLISRYDFEKLADEHNLFLPGMLSGDDYFTTRKTTFESDRQYFLLGLVPGFRMNIYRSFGIDFTFGSLAYRIKTAESILPDLNVSREFNIDFTPENWMVGFYFAF